MEDSSKYSGIPLETGSLAAVIHRRLRCTPALATPPRRPPPAPGSGGIHVRPLNINAGLEDPRRTDLILNVSLSRAVEGCSDPPASSLDNSGRVVLMLNHFQMFPFLSAPGLLPRARRSEPDRCDVLNRPTKTEVVRIFHTPALV